MHAPLDGLAVHAAMRPALVGSDRMRSIVAARLDALTAAPGCTEPPDARGRRGATRRPVFICVGFPMSASHGSMEGNCPRGR
ncbi:hypothetical protein ACFZBU_33620 [Embleya sp. NPDC008237]|uniref:hypothetical protein n=1 Tax=Embleya sp. NPDC008237 TaxID=3363978 RepID=UPI0036EB4595